ncbi:UPF0158 family protein [Salibacterium aidingense]|uniref:UPF0158 family protein n=1 Tax=Salibacterium aidingense TaxID=384933 RepID=UPI0004002130|nr:UPF0158 family protein [Salibacterium aidingense]
MNSSIHLDTVVEAVMYSPDQVTSFLNRETGDVVQIREDVLRRAQVKAPHGMLDAEEKQERQWADAVVSAGADIYLPLPDRRAVDEYQLMEEFIQNLKNPMMRSMLTRELTGSGVFRRFQDRVLELGLAGDWEAFRNEGYRAFARGWCEAHYVPYVDE